MSSGRVSSVGLVVGLVLSAAIIALFAARMDWAQFQAALADVRWHWVAAGCLGVAMTISVRAARWTALSGARAFAGSYWNATVVGYVGNMLYPGRAGEVLRIAALRKALRVPPGELVATALMDRMADVIALGFIAAAAGVYTTAISGDALVRVVISMLLAPAVGLVALLALGRRLQPGIARLCARLPGEWSGRIPRWFGQALDACRALGRRERWIPVVVFTAVAYCIDYAVLWLFLKAFGWQLPLGAAVTVGVLLAIGTLLPAAPGYLGIYQVACVLGLAPYGIGESAALAYSVVAQGSTVLAIASLGMVAAVRYGSGFRLRQSE